MNLKYIIGAYYFGIGELIEHHLQHIGLQIILSGVKLISAAKILTLLQIFQNGKGDSGYVCGQGSCIFKIHSGFLLICSKKSRLKL